MAWLTSLAMVAWKKRRLRADGERIGERHFLEFFVGLREGFAALSDGLFEAERVRFAACACGNSPGSRERRDRARMTKPREYQVCHQAGITVKENSAGKLRVPRAERQETVKL